MPEPILATANLTRRFDGWATPAPVAPERFELRRLASEADVAARVTCGRAAFPGSRMTVERYEKARQSTLYRPALDWLEAAGLMPDGQLREYTSPLRAI